MQCWGGAESPNNYGYNCNLQHKRILRTPSRATNSDSTGTAMMVWQPQYGVEDNDTCPVKNTTFSEIPKDTKVPTFQCIVNLTKKVFKFRSNNESEKIERTNNTSTQNTKPFRQQKTDLNEEDTVWKHLQNQTRGRPVTSNETLIWNSWTKWKKNVEDFITTYSFWMNVLRIVAAFYQFHTLDNQMRKKYFEIEVFRAVEVALFMLAMAPWPYLGHTIWVVCLLVVVSSILLWELYGRDAFDTRFGFSTCILYESKEEYEGFHVCGHLPPDTHVFWGWHLIAFMHPSWAQFGRMYKWHDKFAYYEARRPWFGLCKHVHKLAWLKAMMYFDMYRVLMATTRIRDVITWWFEKNYYLPTLISKETWHCYGWWLMLAFLLWHADCLYHTWCRELKTTDFFWSEMLPKTWGFETQMDRHSDDVLKVVFLALFVCWPLETFVVIRGRICIHCTGKILYPEEAKRKYQNRKIARLWLLLACGVLMWKYQGVQFALQSAWESAWLTWLVDTIFPK